MTPGVHARIERLLALAFVAGCYDAPVPAAIDAAVDAEPELPVVTRRVPDHQHTSVATGVTLDAAITDASRNALPGAPVSWMFRTAP